MYQLVYKICYGSILISSHNFLTFMFYFDMGEDTGRTATSKGTYRLSTTKREFNTITTNANKNHSLAHGYGPDLCPTAKNYNDKLRTYYACTLHNKFHEKGTDLTGTKATLRLIADSRSSRVTFDMIVAELHFLFSNKSR